MEPLLIHAAIPPEQVGLTQLRIRQPLAALARLPGVECRIESAGTGIVADRRPMAKIMVMQRRILSLADGGRLLRALAGADYVTVMEIDDHPLRQPGYAAGGFLSFRGVHAVQTSTEPLAAVLRAYNPHVMVLPNQIAMRPAPRRYGTGTVLFFGALHRQADWAPVMPALNRLMAKRPGVRAEVVHDREFFDALATANKNFTPTLPYDDYLARLGQADVVLLPLLDGPVNRCKSDVKFIEAAAAGAAALASPTVYERTIRHGETGLLYRDEAEFADGLAKLLDHPDERHRLAAAARAYVGESRLLDQHIVRQLDWYRGLVRERAGLNAEIHMRIPNLL
jgi:glycosyltransferase involved in cell wall biosynthesis